MKISFSTEIPIRSARQTFPRLRGLKKDEKVRIQLVDPTNIEVEFVHNLEAPVIEDGAGVRTEKGDWKMRYMGSPLSKGDYGTLTETGLDAKNCIISAFAKKHPDWVQAPKRKFAMHAIKYKTKPGTFELSSPFSVEHIVWVFTDNMFARLQELQKEWGDLRQHDLYITCTNEKFQQYEVQPAPKAAWLDDLKGTKQNYTLAKQTYDAGVEEYPNLSVAIGQDKELKYLEMDLRDIEEAWNIVLGKGDAQSIGTAENLDNLLDDVIAQEEWKEPASAEAPAELPDLDEAPAEAEEATDFDSLLAELG